MGRGPLRTARLRLARQRPPRMWAMASAPSAPSWAPDPTSARASPRRLWPLQTRPPRRRSPRSLAPLEATTRPRRFLTRAAWLRPSRPARGDRAHQIAARLAALATKASPKAAAASATRTMFASSALAGGETAVGASIAAGPPQRTWPWRRSRRPCPTTTRSRTQLRQAPCQFFRAPPSRLAPGRLPPVFLPRAEAVLLALATTVGRRAKDEAGRGPSL